MLLIKSPAGLLKPSDTQNQAVTLSLPTLAEAGGELMIEKDDCCLTVVATSRNDNHGGNLLRRMQLFINGFAEQCKRHQLDAELILVEWNPPPDKPRLAEALSWPSEKGHCSIQTLRPLVALSDDR
jgi:hypothetical protein